MDNKPKSQILIDHEISKIHHKLERLADAEDADIITNYFHKLEKPHGFNPFWSERGLEERDGIFVKHDKYPCDKTITVTRPRSGYEFLHSIDELMDYLFEGCFVDCTFKSEPDSGIDTPNDKASDTEDEDCKPKSKNTDSNTITPKKGEGHQSLLPETITIIVSNS